MAGQPRAARIRAEGVFSAKPVQPSSAWQTKKTARLCVQISDCFLQVPLNGIFSNPFLEDLAKLWELRHIIPDPENYGKR